MTVVTVGRVVGRTLLAIAAGMALAGDPVPIGAQATAPIFRLVTFEANGDMRLGATAGDGDADILDVHNGIRWLIQSGAPEAQSLPYIPADMRSLIEAGPRSIAAVRQVYQTLTARKASGALKEPGGRTRVFHPPTSVRMLAPVTNPSKIYGLAGNYPREGDLANPKFPSAFFKSPASLAAPGDVIDLHGLVTKGVHEPEMSFVIGRRAKNVPEAQVFDYIVGYTICNDVSARDLEQGAHPTQGATFSKGIDTFSPCGPYLTLKEDVPDPHNLAIEARINGKPSPMPNSNTRFLTFKIPQIVAYISRRMTLLPGDIIQTGVPAPVVPLKAGDSIEITVERLGTLRNRVAPSASGTQ
jgi:2-keto-4-pentenoate hydratase/2-oxohepta-3-ene-1,7-dioic acid hydratase in catechol pathway